MSLYGDLEKLATAAVVGWPDIAFSGQFDTAIRDLYRSHLRFPPSWAPWDCEEFITSNADMDAARLTIEFDNLVHTVIDRYGSDKWVFLHDEDAAAMIDAGRKAAVYELEYRIEALSDELTKVATHSLGRIGASMTGCSPANRRLRAPNRRFRRRRRGSR